MLEAENKAFFRGIFLHLPKLFYMSRKDLYIQLEYDGFLTDISAVEVLYPDYKEIEALGADKVYFSGDFPTILFVEVDSFNDIALKRIADIHHKAWNYRRVLLLFALSDTEIRIYNCHEKPNRIDDQKDIQSQLEPIHLLTHNAITHNLDILQELFSRIGVDCGLLWTTDSAVRDKINFQRRLDNFLVATLKQTVYELGQKGITDIDVIHSLLMRSLFILFLEDKGAAKETSLYSTIKEGAKSYFDILDDKSATYKLFTEVQEHFNGNVLPVLNGEYDLVTEDHLGLIKRCFLDGNLDRTQTALFDWRLFNFEIIQIELLSEIYENFLGVLQEERGQYYTPFTLVELMLNDKLSIKSNNFTTKALDPACGSGIFLVESFKRLGRVNINYRQ